MNSIVSWLTLKTVPGVGNLLCRRLVDRFGSPQAVLTADADALLHVEGVSPRIARAIRRHRTPDQVLREIDLAHRQGVAILTPDDQRYPALLLQIPDPPAALFCYGHPAPMPWPVAVVGSRRATHYGLTITRRLGTQLAERGVAVVSGMALGIDTAAHQGALEGNGTTVAVLGSGLQHVYPPQNIHLFHRIAEKGCVITEFFSKTPPEAHHFPMRNRIISGLSLGTVVVEAARRSGSLITARLALEQNRDVFAVPGSVHAATARGTHDLIKQGAKLVENAEDILEEIMPYAPGASPSAATPMPLPQLPPPEAAVFAALDAYPVHIDELVRRMHEDIGNLTSILSQLELKGMVCQEPGKRFFRHPDYVDERGRE